MALELKSTFIPIGNVDLSWSHPELISYWDITHYKAIDANQNNKLGVLGTLLPLNI